MSSSARAFDSLDAIKDFRAYLVKFKDGANSALGDADSDLNRVQAWLDVEQTNFWTGQIRKRHDILMRAEEALRHKKLFKDSSGNTPSAVDEQKAVQVAKKNLAEAHQKMENIKKWLRKLPVEAVRYRGGVSRFAGTVSSLSMAQGALGATIEHVEKYLGLGPAPAVGGAAESGSTGAGRDEGSGASMARADGEAAPAVEKIDVAALRAVIPTEEDVKVASTLAGPLGLACGAVSKEQQEALKAAVDYPGETGEGELFVVARAALSAKRVFLAHVAGAGSKASWCVGVVGGDAANGYNAVKAADVLGGRADFAEFMTVPVGWVVVVGEKGLEGVFDKKDLRVI